MRTLILVLLSFWLVVGAAAQDGEQLAQVEAGDFTALAVTADGSRLMVADAENQQIRVYDLSTPTEPRLFTAIDADGTPQALAAADGYVFAAIAGEGDDSVQVIAPSPFDPRNPYLIGSGYFDVPENPRAIKLSPNGNWGLVISEDGLTTLRIYAQDDILSLPTNITVTDADLTNDFAYLLMGDHVEIVPLSDQITMQVQQQQQQPTVIDLPGEGSRIAVTQDTGAVALGSTLLTFALDAPETQGALEFDAPITGLYPLGGGGLAITLGNSGALTIVDVRDPANPVDLGSTDPLFDDPIVALTTDGELFFATDGSTITIFST